MSIDDQLKEAFYILDQAQDQFKPISVVGMYSGGNDSLAVARILEIWSAMRNVPFHVAHINTGIGIDETRMHVRATARDRNWSFYEFSTPPDHYIRMVTGQERHRSVPGGFPGAPLHSIYYRDLKDRRVEEMMRCLKQGHKRTEKVMLVSGIRRQESRRRMGYASAINTRGSQIWVNPCLNWSANDVYDLRDLHKLPQSPVSALLHRSGECLCGAMADEGEYEEVCYWFPKTGAYLRKITEQVHAAGFLWNWDQGPPEWHAVPNMTKDVWDSLSRDVQLGWLQWAHGKAPDGWQGSDWAVLPPKLRRRLRQSARVGQFDFLPLCLGCEARHGKS